MSKAVVLEQPQENAARASQAQDSDIISLAHDGQQNIVRKATQASFAAHIFDHGVSDGVNLSWLVDRRGDGRRQTFYKVLGDKFAHGANFNKPSGRNTAIRP